MEHFIIPKNVLSGASGREILNTTENIATIVANNLAVQKIEDSLLNAGVAASELPFYTPRDISGNGSHPLHITNSIFGRPFIGSLILCPTGQQTLDANDLSTIITLPEVRISTCIIEVSNKKNIVKTQFPGRDGTIKTYMNTNDYEVNIEAFITSGDDYQRWNGGNFNGIYPYALVNDIVKICEAHCVIKIQSDFLGLFNTSNGSGKIPGINYLSIDSYEISQEPGMYSQQTIKLTCSSDDPSVYKSVLNY